jgi:hypothetical protein
MRMLHVAPIVFPRVGKRKPKRGEIKKKQRKTIVIGKGDLVKTQSTHSQFKKD